MRGADPKFLTDSTDSSSAEDGDSCTHSSSEEDSTEHESNIELNDSQNSASNENICLTLNIPDQIKNILEEDVIKIKCRKKVILQQVEGESNNIFLLISVVDKTSL